jgi:hypothetical protein
MTNDSHPHVVQGRAIDSATWEAAKLLSELLQATNGISDPGELHERCAVFVAALIDSTMVQSVQGAVTMIVSEIFSALAEETKSIATSDNAS